MNHPGEINCPLSSTKAGFLMDVLDLPRQALVVDVGCGAGVFLVRLVERFQTTGKGIDVDEAAIHAAKELANVRGVASRVQFESLDVATADIPHGTYDGGICLGATHAFAMGEQAYPAALEGMSGMVRDDGLLLIGEGYWKCAPAKEYVDFIGEPTGCYRTHEENVALAEQLGLTPLLAMSANTDEWDEFEWRHHRHVLQATECDTTVEGNARRHRAVAWRNAYLKWGRATMGFGYYIFRNGPPA